MSVTDQPPIQALPTDDAPKTQSIFNVPDFMAGASMLAQDFFELACSATGRRRSSSDRHNLLKKRIMAIVRIDFSSVRPSDFGPTCAAVVNHTMQDVLGVPPRENYIVWQGRAKEEILHAPGECPPDRISDIVFIQVTLNQGRSVELKEKFFDVLCRNLVATGIIESNNIYINLVEVARENWAFGRQTA